MVAARPEGEGGPLARAASAATGKAAARALTRGGSSSAAAFRFGPFSGTDYRSRARRARQGPFRCASSPPKPPSPIRARCLSRALATLQKRRACASSSLRAVAHDDAESGPARRAATSDNGARHSRSWRRRSDVLERQENDQGVTTPQAPRSSFAHELRRQDLGYPEVRRLDDGRSMPPIVRASCFGALEKRIDPPTIVVDVQPDEPFPA